MKRCIDVRGSSALGSLLVFALGSACQVVVEKSDATGGQPGAAAQSTGGAAQASGGTAPGVTGGRDASSDSAGTSNGGNPSAATGGSGAPAGASAGGVSAGGVSATNGGAASAGKGGEPQSGAPYVEACGSPEAVANDDRAGAIDLSPGATICLEEAGDHDWFYLDTPDDGKGHVIQLDFEQEPDAWFNMTIYAKQDGSEIGSARLDRGVKGTVYVTVGPGARTLFDIRPFVAREALTTIKASLTTENDSHEPNNVRDDAAVIQPGTEISAQMFVPYVADTQRSANDWYQVELGAGEHVFRLTSVPEELLVDVDISDSARVAIDSGRAPNRGAIFEFAFEVETAGSYIFDVSSFSAPPIVMIGTKPHFLAEPYKFQID